MKRPALDIAGVEQKLMDQEFSRARVVFLDRDGVINRDSPDYIKSWEEFEFLPGSLEAIKRLISEGFIVMVITNQSAVNRQMVTPQELDRTHSLMKIAVRDHGGDIQDIFVCPHIPEDDCECRKPKPGLIHQAQAKYRINLAAATMVGDSAKDILCGRRAGCAYTVLVQTGNGLEAQKTLADQGVYPDHVARDLWDAVDWITAQGPGAGCD